MLTTVNSIGLLTKKCLDKVFREPGANDGEAKRPARAIFGPFNGHYINKVKERNTVHPLPVWHMMSVALHPTFNR